MPSPAFRLVVLGLALAIAGCGSERRVPLHGKVTLDNAPVTEGNIVFLPESGASTKAAAPIVQGQYALAAEDAIAPGSYRVEIHWPKPTGRKIASADPGIMTDETREAIPARYNTTSTLTVDISADKIEHDFSLTSK